MWVFEIDLFFNEVQVIPYETKRRTKVSFGTPKILIILRFVKLDVESKISEYLKNELETEEYDANHSVTRSKELSTKILDLLKKSGYPRYKFIVQVVITSSTGQGIRVASRFLWDPSTDNYASASFKNVSVLQIFIYLWEL